jgi:heat shock protein HspQ
MSNDGNGNWIVNILNNNTTTIKSVPESIILNSEKKVYSKLEESKKQNVFYTGEQNLSLQYSDNELGNAIIDQLQDTFGLNI